MVKKTNLKDIKHNNTKLKAQIRALEGIKERKSYGKGNILILQSKKSLDTIYS